MDYEIEDLRTGTHSDDISLPGITLRDYQESMVRSALEAKGCIIKAPTGAGKTLILGGILKALKGQTGLIFSQRSSYSNKRTTSSENGESTSVSRSEMV